LRLERYKVTAKKRVKPFPYLLSTRHSVREGLFIQDQKAFSSLLIDISLGSL
jgi:hypothetical protein